MTDDIRVLIVDDDMFVRNSLGDYINDAAGLTLVGVAGDGAEAVCVVQQRPVDVVLTDIRMPVMDGVAATRAILASRPDVRVLLLTSFDDDDLVASGLAAGALGFLLKSTPPEDLIAALRLVARGVSVVAPQPLRRMVGYRPTRPSSTPVSLTESEKSVLDLLCQGRSNQQISNELYLSESTVKLRLTTLGTKFGTTTRVTTALRAMELGFGADGAR